MPSFRLPVWPVVLLVLTVSAFSQTPDTAILRGTVYDQSHAAIAGAELTVTNQQTGLRRSAFTDANGAFSIASLPVTGAYEILAHKAGFADSKSENLTLRGGTTADLDIQLSAAGTSAEVTVTGTAGEVRTDQPQLGTWLSSAQIEQTPLPNRRMTFLPLLNAANRPAISTGDLFMNQNLFTTNGAGRRQAWYEVDGGNAVDLWGRQTVFSALPADSLQEMTVLTNAFSAEYGGGVGSAVNIVTRSGGNKYHGSGVAMFRPADLGARLKGATSTGVTTGAQITTDSLQQGALDFSGPMFGDKTHFFVSGEYTSQDRVSPVTSAVAPGNFVGEYRGWLGLVRLDHQFNERNNGFLRLNADSFQDTNPAGAVGANTLPTVGRLFKRRTYTAEVGETAAITPSLLNNVRAAFELASPITEFDPFLLGTQFQVSIPSIAATFTTGTSQSAKLQNHQFELSDTISYTTGRHTLKFGVDAIRAHSGGNSKEFGGPIYLGQFVFKPCPLATPVLTCETTYLTDINNVQSYTQSFGNAVYTQDDTLWSVFAQDDIRVSSNFTANVGIRYERQTFTDATKNFAPRVGFAYNLFGDGKTVLRGGYGIYYSQIPDNAAANYALTGPTGVFNFTAQAGQPGFPTSISAAPLPAFPVGAQVPLRTLYIRPGRASYYDQFFPTSTLIGYPDQLLNPYSQQWTIGLENQLAKNWVLSIDYVGSKTIKINRPLDVDPPSTYLRTPTPVRSAQAANCTRPFWVWWYAQHGTTCNPNAASNPQPPYALITSDVNNGYANYNALDINLSHRFSQRMIVLASYTWSHALDNVDPDIPQQNPNDPNKTGRDEYANAIFDQRHRFVLSGMYTLPLKINFGGVMTLASGLPYNITTGTTNSGDAGGTTDRPMINGVILGRNAGHGKPIYEVSPFVERAFPFGERIRVNLRAEAFNLLNHANFVGYNSVFGNGNTPGSPAFGTPNVGIAAQLPPRSFQFTARVSF